MSKASSNNDNSEHDNDIVSDDGNSKTITAPVLSTPASFSQQQKQ